MGEHPLDPIFHPRSIALVGVPRRLSRGGVDFLLALLDQGYDERKPLYIVNPNAEEIAGQRCYPSLLACPDPVDHVISLVPADRAPELVAHCVARRVRSLHFYTAGFAESGGADRAALERELVATARAGGVRVLGPNSMGLYVPAERIAFDEGLPTQPGNVFAISQSGGNARDIVMGLAARGVRFSKVVSFGNGRDIAAAELFDYAATDTDTSIVVAYLEGVPDGRALLRAMRACAREKPTIVLKGGLSQAGARAANSHTASLAGSTAIFDALCRQAGAIRIDTMHELHDLVIAVSTGVRRIRGNQALLVGSGGGFSVLSADEIARHGIDLPPLPDEVQDRLRAHIPIAGNSVRNPIDASFLGDDVEQTMRAVLNVTSTVPGVDFLFVPTGGAPAGPGRGRRRTGLVALDPEHAAQTAERERRAMTELADLQERHARPLAVVRRARARDRQIGEPVLELALARGLAVFPSIPRAARAVSLLLQWRAAREGLPILF